MNQQLIQKHTTQTDIQNYYAQLFSDKIPVKLGCFYSDLDLLLQNKKDQHAFNHIDSPHYQYIKSFKTNDLNLVIQNLELLIQTFTQFTTELKQTHRYHQMIEFLVQYYSFVEENIFDIYQQIQQVYQPKNKFHHNLIRRTQLAHYENIQKINLLHHIS